MGLTGDGSDWAITPARSRGWETAERKLYRGSFTGHVILSENNGTVIPRIVIRKGEIELGCTKVEIDVLRYLIAEYDAAFSPSLPAQKVLQP